MRPGDRLCKDAARQTKVKLSYYGSYDAAQKDAGRPSKNLQGPKPEDWTPPAKANKPYSLGVSFPHLKDPYWLAVDYSIIKEAVKQFPGKVEILAVKWGDTGKNVQLSLI